MNLFQCAPSPPYYYRRTLDRDISSQQNLLAYYLVQRGLMLHTQFRLVCAPQFYSLEDDFNEPTPETLQAGAAT